MQGTRPEIVHDEMEAALREVTGVRPALRPASRVLIASQEPGGAAALSANVQGTLEIEHLEHIGHLMEVAPDAREGRVALVLDCRTHIMHPASVAALADELPYGWWVVAWGIDDITWDELEPDRRGNLHWVRCPDSATWKEVAGLVATLLAAGC